MTRSTIYKWWGSAKAATEFSVHQRNFTSKKRNRRSPILGLNRKLKSENKSYHERRWILKTFLCYWLCPITQKRSDSHPLLVLSTLHHHVLLSRQHFVLPKTVSFNRHVPKVYGENNPSVFQFLSFYTGKKIQEKPRWTREYVSFLKTLVFQTI